MDAGTRPTSRIARALPALDLSAHLPLLFAHLVRLDDAAPNSRRQALKSAIGPPAASPSAALGRVALARGTAATSWLLACRPGA